MDVKGAIRELTMALSNTNEFIELKKQKSVVNKDQAMRTLLEQFQKKQEIPYQSKLSQSQLQLVMDDINRDYEKLLTVPEIKRYFEVSDNFNQMLSSVMKAVNEGLDRELRQ